MYWDYRPIKDTFGTFPIQKGVKDKALKKAVRIKKDLRVLYAGTLRETADDYVEAVSLAGIEPIVLDIESAALGRALLSLPLKTSSLIVDIGSRTTILGIFDTQALLRLSVIIPIAGIRFTEAIAKKLKIKTNEAEEIKKKDDPQVLPILQANLQKIVKEIKGAIVYYEKQTGEKIEEIILSGGSAQMPGLSSYFNKELGSPVSVGKPVIALADKVESARKAPSIVFATVIGLALRGLNQKSLATGVNLLPGNANVQEKPDEEKDEMKLLIVRLKKRNKRMVELIILLVLVIIMLPLAFWFQGYQQQKRDFERDIQIKKQLEAIPFSSINIIDSFLKEGSEE
jgi:cell division ATPase FtsA